jgi:hypothetical protein
MHNIVWNTVKTVSGDKSEIRNPKSETNSKFKTSEMFKTRYASRPNKATQSVALQTLRDI